MKFKHQFFRFLNDAPDAGGTGVVDRGDDLTPPEPKAPEVKVDPAAEALETELDAEAGKGGEADADAEEAKPKKDTRLPLARHEAILQKERDARKELEQKLAKYENGEQVAATNTKITEFETNISKLEKQAAAALADGEIDKYTEAMGLIRKDERAMAAMNTQLMMQAAEARATERARYNTALDRIEASFPVLNPDHESFDSEISNDVLDLKALYEARGLTPTDAMQKAVKAIVEPRTAKQADAVTVTPRVAEKDVAAERKKEATAKTVKALAATPASLSKSGMDSDKLGGGAVDAAAVMSMSQKEFAALSEETLARMRGDLVE